MRTLSKYLVKVYQSNGYSLEGMKNGIEVYADSNATVGQIVKVAAEQVGSNDIYGAYHFSVEGKIV